MMHLDLVCGCLIGLDLVALNYKKPFVAPPFGGLTDPRGCSTFVHMQVETRGVARSLGWKVHMRCANGYRESTRSMRRCVYRKQLDLETLVATRGPNFPLGGGWKGG
jgi:hypothetical protein